MTDHAQNIITSHSHPLHDKCQISHLSIYQYFASTDDQVKQSKCSNDIQSYYYF